MIVLHMQVCTIQHTDYSPTVVQEKQLFTKTGAKGTERKQWVQYDTATTITSAVRSVSSAKPYQRI